MLILVLAQSASAPPASFLRDHADVAAWAFGFLVLLLFSALAVLGGLTKWGAGKVDLVFRKLEELRQFYQVEYDAIKKDTGDIEKRVALVENTQEQYQQELNAKVENESLDIKCLNESIAKLADGQMMMVDRVSRVETQFSGLASDVEEIKKRLPNGEMKEAINLLKQLLKRGNGTAKRKRN